MKKGKFIEKVQEITENAPNIADIKGELTKEQIEAMSKALDDIHALCLEEA